MPQLFQVPVLSDRGLYVLRGGVLIILVEVYVGDV